MPFLAKLEIVRQRRLSFPYLSTGLGNSGQWCLEQKARRPANPYRQRCAISTRFYRQGAMASVLRFARCPFSARTECCRPCVSRQWRPWRVASHRNYKKKATELWCLAASPTLPSDESTKWSQEVSSVCVFGASSSARSATRSDAREEPSDHVPVKSVGVGWCLVASPTNTHRRHFPRNRCSKTHPSLGHNALHSVGFHSGSVLAPYPPPPGVSMRTRSFAAAWKLIFPPIGTPL